MIQIKSVCVWEKEIQEIPCWAHHSAASFYSPCHADERVSEWQTLLLQQKREEERDQKNGLKNSWFGSRVWKTSRTLLTVALMKHGFNYGNYSWTHCYPNIVHLHLVHVLGRGVCKNSSPAVVQHSDLRWPARMLQRKKSISGHRLGWLILGSRGRTKWSKMAKWREDRGQKGRDETVNCSGLQTQRSASIYRPIFCSVKALSLFVPRAQSNVSFGWTMWFVGQMWDLSELCWKEFGSRRRQILSN